MKWKTAFDEPPQVLFVSPIWATYRADLIHALKQDGRVKILCWGSRDGIAGSHIQQMSENDLPGFRDTPLAWLPLGLLWQRKWIWRALLSRSQIVVLTGDAHYLATWLAAPLLRFAGKRVFFWTHGWPRPERGLKRLIRRCFYNLADGLLLYSQEKLELASRMGVPAERMHVVNNSQGRLARRLTIRQPCDPQRWIVITRLIPGRRIEDLLSQLADLQRMGRDVSLTIVGDGPCRSELERHADRLSVKADFVGAVYNEHDTADLLQSHDVLVAPGSIGLAAVHALSNGCPVSTHDDANRHGPEHVVVEDGITGVRWPYGDFHRMAQMTYSFVSGMDRSRVAVSCQRTIANGWTPEAQASRFIDAFAAEGVFPTRTLTQTSRKMR